LARIAVVDQSGYVRRTFQMMLEAQGHAVLTYPTLRQAIDQGDDRFDLFIVEDGLDLSAQKDSNQIDMTDLPMIAVTQGGPTAGTVPTLTKPVAMADLWEAVNCRLGDRSDASSPSPSRAEGEDPRPAGP
jgi:DNA-binding response OmpR family regulator